MGHPHHPVPIVTANTTTTDFVNNNMIMKKNQNHGLLAFIGYGTKKLKKL